MPETQNLVVNYILKGEDVQHAFTKAYTMLEHFNDVPRKEGKAFAIKKHDKQIYTLNRSIKRPKAFFLYK